MKLQNKLTLVILFTFGLLTASQDPQAAEAATLEQEQTLEECIKDCPPCPKAKDKKCKEANLKNEQLEVEILNLQSNLDQCIQTSQKEIEYASQCKQEVASLSTNIESQTLEISEANGQLTECKSSNSNLVSKLERKQKKLDQYLADVKAMHKKNDILQKDLDRKSDSFLKTREELTDLEREYRSLLRKSETTYVNVTLIAEDLKFSVMNGLDVGFDKAARFMRHESVVAIIHAVQSRVLDPIAKQSNIVYNELGIDQRLTNVGQRLTSVDAIEGFRRTCIGLIENGSRILLNYMELTGKLHNDSFSRKRNRPQKFNQDTKKNKFISHRDRTIELSQMKRERRMRSFGQWLQSVHEDSEAFFSRFLKKSLIVFFIYTTAKVLLAFFSFVLGRQRNMKID